VAGTAAAMATAAGATAAATRADDFTNIFMMLLLFTVTPDATCARLPAKMAKSERTLMRCQVSRRPRRKSGGMLTKHGCGYQGRGFYAHGHNLLICPKWLSQAPFIRG
jgi:hypothetical protein